MIESSAEKSSAILPKDISGLIDSTFLFKVESNLNSDTRFETSYRVKKICNTENIIVKFKETESNTNYMASMGSSNSADTIIDKGKFANVDIAQDLLNKFDDAVKSPKISDAIEAIDLTSESDNITPFKRSYPFGEENSTNPNSNMLKNIKIEKN
ncbi:hypothetical protein P8452_22750 [Trifolium repens]|nr:hypothetical protein P8452_22750 [Trifolium repens]